MKKAVVIGAGISGCTVARALAEKGYKVTVFEKRNHIGGNAYECFDEHGIRIHKYGSHIFHTNEQRVYDFLSRFTEWYPYEHKVLGLIDKKFVPIPFNFTSLEALFDKKESDYLKEKLTRVFEGKEKVSVLDLLNADDDKIKDFGQFVFDKVFVNYTAKQWGVPIEQVDKSVINRVPVILGYDDRYFQDKFQVMPLLGFTDMINNMLNHKNIKVKLNFDAKKLFSFRNGKVYKGSFPYFGKVIITAAIDEMLNYVHGVLPYRSLEFEFTNYNQPDFQAAAVVNYPNDEKFTRITEFKKLTNQIADTTTVAREYPMTYDIKAEKGNIPYYVINNEKNNLMYSKYKAEIEGIKNVSLLGRLAEYKYYNMDNCVLKALELADKISV